MNNEFVYKAAQISRNTPCATCNKIVKPGDYFSMKDDKVYCTAHDIQIQSTGSQEVIDTTGGKWMESFIKKD